MEYLISPLRDYEFHLKIYVPLTLNVATQHTEVLTVTLDLTLNISKQPTLHNPVH